MKFHVRQNEIQEALSVIKNSKALGKPDEELFSTLKIESFNENGKNRVRFTASNTVAWASASIMDEKYEEMLGGNDIKSLFDVQENSTVYVDGHNFIDVILGYPENAIISFDVAKKKKNDEEISSIVCECFRNNKKEKKKSTFLIKVPSFFQDSPPDEVRETKKVSCRDLLDAAMSVEFASSTDSKNREYWGIFLEIRDTDISACATDKQRICWYDKEGIDRDESLPVFKFNPIKVPLVAALKASDSKKEVTLEVGERFSVLRQFDRWHAIPNVIKSSQGDGSDFDWRKIAKKVHDNTTSSIRIPRKNLKEYAKLATSAGGASDFAIRIKFDTINKKVYFTVEKIEGGGVICSHEEEINIDDNQFDGNICETIMLTVDSITDIASKYNSDQITFRIKDNSNPIEMLSDKDNFRFITGTVDDPEQNPEEEEEEEAEEEVETVE